MNSLSKKTLRALSSKGIVVLSTALIPDTASAMPWANASVGFNVSDNGCGRVLPLSEVLKLASRA